MKRFLLALLLSVAVATPVMAGTEAPSTEAPSASQVQSILSNPEGDQRVVLRGQISSEGDGKYTLNDDTGSIRVEIDQDALQGQAVAGKTVEIEGTVDENMFSEPTVEAERVTVLDEEAPSSESASRG